jgi:hypothetical protein
MIPSLRSSAGYRSVLRCLPHQSSQDVSRKPVLGASTGVVYGPMILCHATRNDDYNSRLWQPFHLYAWLLIFQLITIRVNLSSSWHQILPIFLVYSTTNIYRILAQLVLVLTTPHYSPGGHGRRQIREDESIIYVRSLGDRVADPSDSSKLLNIKSRMP